MYVLELEIMDMTMVEYVSLSIMQVYLKVEREHG